MPTSPRVRLDNSVCEIGERSRDRLALADLSRRSTSVFPMGTLSPISAHPQTLRMNILQGLFPPRGSVRPDRRPPLRTELAAAPHRLDEDPRDRRVHSAFPPGQRRNSRLRAVVFLVRQMNVDGADTRAVAHHAAYDGIQPVMGGQDWHGREWARIEQPHATFNAPALPDAY